MEDKDEIDTIIERYYHDIYQYCYWKVRSAVEAQDLTQETFFRFWCQYGKYVERGKPQAYLYTIARNLCMDWFKKDKTHLQDTVSKEVLDVAATLEFNTLINKMMLSDAVSSLPSNQQEVLLLRYGQELGVGEIAIILGVTRFTVMYRIKCGLGTLRKMDLGGD